jgi:hypothetical protein
VTLCLVPASTIVSSVFLVFRLEVEDVIYLSLLKKMCVRSLPPDAVDPASPVEANRAVRSDPLVRNDLVRTTRSGPPYREGSEAVISANKFLPQSFTVYR